MANPKIQIEISATGIETIVPGMKKVTAEANQIFKAREKLNAQRQKAQASSKKEVTDLGLVAGAMKRVVSSNKLAGQSLNQLGERMEAITSRTKLNVAGMRQLGSQMQRVVSSNNLASQSYNILSRQMGRVISSNKLAGQQFSHLGTTMHRMASSAKLAAAQESKLASAEMRVAAATKTANAAKIQSTGATIQMMRRSKDLADKQKRLALTTSKMGKTMRNFGSAAIFAVGPLSGFGARLVAFQAIASRTSVKIAALAAGLAATVVALVKTAFAMGRTAIEVNKILNALKVATGNAASARVEFDFLVRVSRELSLDIASVGTQFAQLAAAARGTSLAGAGVRKIFEAVTKASLVLGLSSEQTTGALRAIQQMMSKGTVQAEELRGQLGERIPGAFQIAARAMDVTTRELGKMLEQGLVVAEDLLPKMADEMEKTFGPQVEDAVTQLGAAFSGLRTESFLFFKTLEDNFHIIEGFSKKLITLKRGFQVLTDVIGSKGFKGELADLDELIAKNERRTKLFTGQLEAVQKGFLAEGNAARRLKEILAGLFLESLKLSRQRRELIQTSVGGGQTFGPPAPILTFDELRNLPTGPVDKFKDTLRGLREVMSDISSKELTIGERLGALKAFDNLTAAGKEASKVMKALTKDQKTALQLISFGPLAGTLRPLEEVRNQIIKLILKKIEFRQATEASVKALADEQKAFEKSAAAQLKAIAKRDKARLMAAGKILAIAAKAEDRAKRELGLANAITTALRMRIAGLTEEARLMEIRAVVEKRFTEATLATKDAIARTILQNEKLAKILSFAKTPLEAYTHEMERLRNLLNDPTFSQFGDKIQRQMERVRMEFLKSNEIFQLIETSLNSMGDTFIDVLKGTESPLRALGLLVQNILEDILKLIIKLEIINPILNSIAGVKSPAEGGGGLPTGFFESIKEMFIATQTTAVQEVGISNAGIQTTDLAVIKDAAYVKATFAMVDVPFMKVGTLISSGGTEDGGGILGGLLGGLLGGDGAAGAGTGFATLPFVPLAGGGPSPTNDPFVVGENGPEVLSFNRSGFVTPNDQLGGSTVIVNQQFDFRGASLEAVSLLKQEAASIKRDTLNAVDMRHNRGVNAARRG